MKWIEIKRENDHAVKGSKGYLNEIPLGPYCLVSQHDSEDFINFPNEVRFEKIPEFRLEFGKCTFAVGPDFKPVKVGYWYSTDD